MYLGQKKQNCDSASNIATGGISVIGDNNRGEEREWERSVALP